MYRYIIFLLLGGWVPMATQCQLTNTSAQVVVSGGYVVVDNLNLVNNGSFTQSAGTVKFTGSSNTIIGGTGIPQLNALELDKPAARLQLQTGLHIDNQVLFTNGIIDLNNNNIVLGPAAHLVGENENSRITGPAGGYVEITNLLNAPAGFNPGNLGVVITSPANMGATVIRRGHVSQSNGANMPNSIWRYYDIIPANNSALQATVGLHYFDAELNGLAEPMLTVWKSPDNTTWTELGYNTRDGATNFVDETNIAVMARFTLTSELYVLPLMINDLHTKCLNNQVVITWQNRGDITTGQFIIDRSLDGANWQPVATLPVTGSLTYAYTDAQSFTGAWYRIVQVADNGHQHISAAVQSHCGITEVARVFPNPAYGNAWLQLQVANKTKVVMHLYDHKGALVKLQTAGAAAGLNQFDLQMSGLPQGIYSLVVHWDGVVKTIKVVKL
ncbi:hypothetical protein A4D02_13680 [Niastella koreensis]|uniref:Secretion system C-terminal sorting domain-containing protein n=2 Tax=Niastella koreensis TaxID=354356 RepID=G8TNS7_NIAKG|nr:T9SS type A sorting domain-containing protein [Niastella koreensis]AEW01003.1 hypothetical protein Niako_4748 [Niastella koreensis GR20-10]OQP42611.1 hypothetical protein A4D02_13680 [Niastella koreensis]